MFKLTGNPQQLKAFEALLREAGSNLDELSEQLAIEAENLSKDSFRKQRDPYGSKWPKRARETKRTRGKQTLVGAGLLKGSINSKSSARGFSVGYGQPHGVYHQTGTSKMVQRMIVPDAGRGIPAKWLREFKAVVRDIMQELFGG